ncbi:MAG: universal stress protein [Bacteroidia bacterium]|nr:universal stress protein [Bacteroidia bacterium]
MDTIAIKKVLVPIDFSELSDNAVRTATAICVRQNASMVMLHVNETTLNIVSPYGVSYMSSTLRGISDTQLNKLKVIAAEINSREKIFIEIAIRTGNVCESICALAEQTKTDLIVMGTHGSSGLREFFIGTSAYHVIRHSPVPVLTVPSAGNWTEFKKILFPVRMVNGAFDKYEAILSIIKKNNSSLIILGLAENNNPSQLPELTDLINKFKSKITQDEIAFEIVIYYGDKLPEKILETAHNYNADLIVITAVLDHTMKDFFVGPYAQQIVNHSKIPVLTIRPRIIETESVLHKLHEMEKNEFSNQQFAV